VIKRLSLRNFRAFKDQTFKFKKLNIFIGKNNSGKSSAISALNVIGQTLKDQTLDGTPLLLNGQYDNLGTYIDVVSGNNPRTRMGFDLEFDSFLIKCEFKYRTQRRQIDLINFELSDKGSSIFKYNERKDAYDIYIMGDKFENIYPETPKRRPAFENFMPRRILPMSMVMRILDRHGGIRREPEKRTMAAERALSAARRALISHFDNFDTVSPFRDKPQRTYLYSGESAREVGVTGSNMAIMLASDASRRGSQSKDLIDQISKWFAYTGIAKGLSVESLTARHFEICLLSNDGTKHNICDVGFGCSQVLPVLTAGLHLFSDSNHSSASKMLVVQEPEIHLHPNAQAAMGSFFVDLARRNGQIFVETHSDNLVLRVARHVALGEISPDDVAIFFVSDESENRVTEIGLTEVGTFDPPWPGGFFPQRQAESLELARAAMHRRSEGDPKPQLEFVYPEAK
jgi:predicted ATPase